MEMNDKGTCTSWLVQPEMEIFESTKSLSDVAARAQAALSGEVVSVTRGFYRGFPGALVGFTVSDSVSVRADPGSTPARGNTRYTFIGSAEILTPDGAICSKTSNPVPVPELGDTILLLSYVLPTDEQGLLYPIDSERHLVIERADERIFIAKGLRQDVLGVNVGEAMRRLRSLSNRELRNR
jgi:hypothetical protein